MIIIMNKQNNKQNNKLKKNISKNQNGGNIGSAAIDLVKDSISLGSSIFKAGRGIMNMPSDLSKAIPKTEKGAPVETKPVKQEKLPNFDNVQNP